MNNKGKLWEIEACNFLRKKKYKLITANYTTRFGEIDLIVENKKYICFVEVKQRDKSSIAKPSEFVDKRKQDKIIKSAMLYMSQYHLEKQPRFDAVEIYTQEGEIKSIKHLENAFELY